MAVRKIMTINIEFELGDRKTHQARVQAVYAAAVAAATQAAEEQLLEGSVAEVRHRMTFDYRWAESASTTPVGSEVEWTDGE